MRISLEPWVHLAEARVLPEKMARRVLVARVYRCEISEKRLCLVSCDEKRGNYSGA
jgi:hypothetical protein